MTFRNPVRRPPDAEVPTGLMLLGLFALLFGTGLLMHTATVALRGELLAAALTGALAALFAVAGCRLWHRCPWALDFLLVCWVGSYLLLTSSWSPGTILGNAALAMPWGAVGALWLVGIVYLVRWRRRWRKKL